MSLSQERLQEAEQNLDKALALALALHAGDLQQSDVAPAALLAGQAAEGRGWVEKTAAPWPPTPWPEPSSRPCCKR